MDVSEINKLWWKHTIPLEEWIKKTYERFLENNNTIKK
jgi:nucleoside-diphosphate-sugar epimerase